MVNLSSVLDGNKAPYTMSDYFLIVFTRLMGCLSLIAMMVFFFVGSLNLVKLEVGESGAFVEFISFDRLFHSTQRYDPKIV